MNAIDANRPARHSLVVRAAVGLECFLVQTLHASTAAPFAAPEQVAASSSSGGLLRVMVGLLVVLGAVIVAARLARRMRSLSGSGNSALQVLGQLPLGTRERAVLIRVGERQLLLGVAQGSVRTLHVFEDLVLPPVPDAAAGPSAAPSFKAMLLRSLGK